MEPKDRTPHINVDYFECLTGDIVAPDAGGVEDVGKRIRDIREQKGLSLEELSNMTGFEVALLSKIEKAEVQPMLGTVIKLSKALDSAFGRLVSGVGDRLYAITRKEDQKVVCRSTSHKGQKEAYTYRSLAPEVKGRHMEALIVQLEALSDSEVSVHDGEEFIYVLDGTVSLSLDEEKFELTPGDSAYYLSTTPHIITAKGGRATILAVIYEG
jgi:transcriptional regulator with XRE-family HTH domain